MSLALHVLAGMWCFRAFGWWGLLAAVVSHAVLDFACWYHPPGMHWPWGHKILGRRPHWPGMVVAIVLDEWQYDRNETYASIQQLCQADYPFAQTIFWKRVLFCVNVVALLALGVATALGCIGWREWAVGAVAWLSFDVFWALRELFPGAWSAWLWRLNPHRAHDWLVLKIWPGGKRDWLPALTWELVPILAAVTLLFVEAR